MVNYKKSKSIKNKRVKRTRYSKRKSIRRKRTKQRGGDAHVTRAVNPVQGSADDFYYAVNNSASKSFHTKNLI